MFTRKIKLIKYLALFLICLNSNASVAIKPKPSIILNNGREIGFMTADNIFSIYTTKNWKKIADLLTVNYIEYISLANRKQFLILGGGIDNNITTFNTHSWNKVSEYKIIIKKTAPNIRNVISDINIIANGKCIAVSSVNGIIYLINISTGKLLKKIELNKEYYLLSIATTDNINSIYILNIDGKLSVIRNQGKIIPIKDKVFGKLCLSSGQNYLASHYSFNNDIANNKRVIIFDLLNHFKQNIIMDNFESISKAIATNNNCFKYVAGYHFKNESNSTFQGMIYNPVTHKKEIIWNTRKWRKNTIQYRDSSLSGMSFKKGLSWGVTTSYDYITTVYDLKTGKKIKVFDFSKNYTDSSCIINVSDKNEKSNSAP